MDLEILIAQVTRNILQELRSTAQQETLVLFARKEQSLPEGLAEIFGTKSRVLYGEDNWNVEDVERFILPCLYLDQMVDLAHGKGGSKLMYAVRQVLLTGRKVEVYQFEYKKYLNTAPKNLLTLYEGYRKQLEGFGLIDCITKRTKAVRIEKSVLTQSDILKAKAESVQHLELSAGCRVTPLAYEVAADLGIHISTTGGTIA